MKLEKQSMNDRITKLEDEVRNLKHIISPSIFQQYAQFQPNSSISLHEQTPPHLKRSQVNLNYGTLNTVESYLLPDDPSNFQKSKRSSLPVYSSSPNKSRNEESCDENQLLQSELETRHQLETVQLRRHLQNVLQGKKQAEDRIIAYV